MKGFAVLMASRIAAALLIVALSGAAGLAPRARAAEHRCECQGMMVNGHHVCSCPICRLAARQAAVRHSVVAEGAAGAVPARPEDGGDTCYVSECDHSHGIAGIRPSTEPFTLPQRPTVVRVAVVAECGENVNTLPGRQTTPELPPPRTHQS